MVRKNKYKKRRKKKYPIVYENGVPTTVTAYGKKLRGQPAFDYVFMGELMK